MLTHTNKVLSMFLKIYPLQHTYILHYSIKEEMLLFALPGSNISPAYISSTYTDKQYHFQSRMLWIFPNFEAKKCPATNLYDIVLYNKTFARLLRKIWTKCGEWGCCCSREVNLSQPIKSHGNIKIAPKVGKKNYKF